MARKRYRRTKRTKVNRRGRRRTRTRWHKKHKTIAGLLLLVAILVGAVFAYRFFVMAPRALYHSFESGAFSSKYVVRGVDVSHHNSFVNWDQLRDENITFVYLKSTEGISHKDSDYSHNYHLARNAGLKVGTYHFYSFGLDGEQQAEHFIRSSNVFSQDLPPAIDVEHSPVNIFTRDKEFRKLTLHELKRLESKIHDHYGRRPMIYTNKECYDLYIKGNFPDSPIWICDLHNEPSTEIENWVIWQFSHSGQLNGADGNIDLNYYRHSFSQFQNLLMP